MISFFLIIIMKIRKIKAEVVLDSKGHSTIGITVNRQFKGSAPLGVTLGRSEVMAFPENGIPIGIVNRTLHNGLKGLKLQDFNDLEEVEKIIFDFDKSINLTRIGGNTVIALEYALLRAMSKNKVWSFLNSNADRIPVPLGCCIGGGKHTEQGADFQEYLLVPHGENFKDNYIVSKYIYKKVKQDLRPVKRSYTGGWETVLDNITIFDLLNNIKEECFDRFGVFVGLGADIAGSHMFSGGEYFYRKGKLSRENQIRYINTLINRYSLEYVEDPLDENDIEGFEMIKGELISGDDIVCSNLEKLKDVVGKINCVCIKPTQIGSLVKLRALIDYAKQNRIGTVISSRAGETADTMISDLGVAWDVDYIKTGIAIIEHAIKLNRLKQIEKEIK